jgi:Protein of unknown function (DUF3303)
MLYMLIGHFRRGAAPSGASSPTRRSHAETPGVTLIGSWVEATLGRSFHVVECESLAGLQQWAAHWRHRVDFELVPIVPAREAAAALEPLLG